MDKREKLTKGADVIPMIESCPICGRQPDVGECGPATKGEDEPGSESEVNLPRASAVFRGLEN
jgi:hypothetical protein